MRAHVCGDGHLYVEVGRRGKRYVVEYMNSSLELINEFVNDVIYEYNVSVCPYRFILFKSITYCIGGRDSHLAHRDLGIPVGSWVVVEPNGTGAPIYV